MASVLAAVSLLSFSSLLYFASCAVITVPPVSINTTLNSTVIFPCQGTGDSLSFQVDGVPANNVAITNRGFTQDIDLSSSPLKGQLQATAYDINNRSNITCVVFTFQSQTVTSPIAVLLIQGILESVEDLSVDQSYNSNDLLITWTPPYSLANTDNTYIIDIIDPNISTQVNNTDTATLSLANIDPCTPTNVSVTSTNGAGIGGKADTSLQFEIVPEAFPDSNITVVFVNDSHFDLQITVQVMNVCSGYYPTTMSVTINNSTSSHDITVLDELIIMNISIPRMHTFTVTVSLSNKGGVFPNNTSVTFGYLGPVTNITAPLVDNCFTINITWNRPIDEVTVSYYILTINDVTNKTIYCSSSKCNYLFKDTNIRHNNYTFTITGVNELGEGQSNRISILYPKKVPAKPVNIMTSVKPSDCFGNVSIDFVIPPVILVDCIGETPDSVTVTIKCERDEKRSSVFQEIYPFNPLLTTAIQNSTVISQLYEQCDFSIVFSNSDGNSLPLIKPLKMPSVTSIPTCTSGVAIETYIYIVVAVIVIVVLAAVILVLTLCGTCIAYSKRKNKKEELEQLQLEVVTIEERKSLSASTETDKKPPIVESPVNRINTDGKSITDTKLVADQPTCTSDDVPSKAPLSDEGTMHNDQQSTSTNIDNGQFTGVTISSFDQEAVPIDKQHSISSVGNKEGTEEAKKKELPSKPVTISEGGGAGITPYYDLSKEESDGSSAGKCEFTSHKSNLSGLILLDKPSPPKTDKPNYEIADQSPIDSKQINN